jgi:hypothetical protein
MQVLRKRGRDVAKIGIKTCLQVECGCGLYFEWKQSGSLMSIWLLNWTLVAPRQLS